jgi:hypothetical protein
MVGHQECFTLDSLALAVGNGSQQISFWIGHKRFHTCKSARNASTLSVPIGHLKFFAKCIIQRADFSVII